MYINKDISSILEDFSNHNNLYNFLYNDQLLDFHCEKCKSTFNSCSNRNKIIYELKEFDNDIIRFLNLDLLDLKELVLLNKITYLEVQYEKVDYIFCNHCIMKVEQIERNHKLNTFGTEDFQYISHKYTNLIKFNNNYFHNDLIESYNVIIDRRKYFYKDDVFYMKLIKLSNYNYNEMLNLRPTNFEELKKILITNFQVNLNYINEYIKTKYV
tara:strand:- start:223 stop:861 length:639 start_codon:yes stop_codon:yes gene_type:complete